MTQSSSTAIVKSSMAAINANVADGFKETAYRAQTAFGQATTDNFFAALEVAAAIDELRSYLDRPEIKARILGLMNTPIGFKTDRDPKIERWDARTNRKVAPTPYSYDIVKDAVVEALLRGLGLVGNQFNIIADRFYCTREGFEHLIRKAPGITELCPIIGVPVQKPGGALVTCKATWMQNGKSRSIEVEIPVKGDEKYATADQYIGKATRKLLKRCYEMMTGNTLSDGDTEDSQQHVSVVPVFNQLAPSTAEVAPAVQAASTSQKLTEAQIKQLQTAMHKVLTPLGVATFQQDAATGYDVSLFEEIPAQAFSDLMRNLGNSQFQTYWNQGCNVSGEQIVFEPEDKLQAELELVSAAATVLPVNSNQIEDQI